MLRMASPSTAATISGSSPISRTRSTSSTRTRLTGWATRCRKSSPGAAILTGSARTARSAGYSSRRAPRSAPTGNSFMSPTSRSICPTPECWSRRSTRHGRSKSSAKRSPRSAPKFLRWPITTRNRRPVRSRAHRGGIHRHAAGPLHQVEFEGDGLRSAIFEGLRAHAGHAAAQSALQRAEALPFEAIDRVTGRVPLRNYAAGEALAPVVVVALAARQVQLTFTLAEQFFAQIEKRAQLGACGYRDRQATRLTGDKRGQREQVLAFPSQWLGPLMLGAAAVDPLLQIERASQDGVERRVAGGDSFHAGHGIAMTILTGPRGDTRFSRP